MKKEVPVTSESLEKIHAILDILQKLKDRLSIVLGVISIAAIIFVLIKTYIDIDRAFKMLINYVSETTGLWVAIGTVFIIGISLSIFKLKQQLWYGVFETVFALISCYYVIKNINTSTVFLSLFIALGSTLYIIVRGFSNILDGTKKPYWCKKDILEIRANANLISSESMVDLLKDKKVLIDILLRIANFIVRLI